MRDRLREEAAIFLLALGFLTRLPVAYAPGLWTPARMAATPRHHPSAGLVVGLLSGGVLVLAALVLPPPVAVLLALGAGILVTGALHEDGLADLCDGLGGGRTPERSLAIMRDSRIGAFGTIGLVVTLGLKAAALAAMPAATAALALVAGHAASRAGPVAVIRSGRYLRADGAGRPVAGGIGTGSLAVAMAVAAVALLPLLLVLPPQAVLLAAGALVLAHHAIRRLFERRLGGYTGDCLGALQQGCETAFYLGLLAWL